MKKFLVTEEERIEILKKHASLMKEQANKASDEDILRAGITAGCLSGGRLLKNNVSGEIYYEKPSARLQGQTVRFLSNQTYYYYNPQTKAKTNPAAFPKPCDAMTNFNVPQGLDKRNQYQIDVKKKAGWQTEDDLMAKGVDLDEVKDGSWDVITIGNVSLFKKKVLQPQQPQQTDAQKKWLVYFEENGYKTNPTDVEKSKLQSVNVEDLGVPAGVFAQGTKVWYDPATQGKLKGKESKISDELESQEINRKTCKGYIEDFYKAFKRSKGLEITNKPELMIQKRRVQACKNLYYPSKWGVLGGGNKMDELIDVLSGQAEGAPTSSGEDAIFRIS